MTTGTPNRAEINVTPLIDVLLVLLIIFLVITPRYSHGLEASIPNPDSKAGQVDERDVVVKIAADRTLSVNSEAVSWEKLSARLQEIYAQRASKVMFLTADRKVEFNAVAQVIDTAHGVGIAEVGLMPGHERADIRSK